MRQGDRPLASSERSNNERRHEADSVCAGHGLDSDRARHPGKHLRRAQGLRPRGRRRANLCREDRDPLWPGGRPQHPARAEHRGLLRGGLALLRAQDRSDHGRRGALRLREQALHRGRGRVLQLRVVHRAHGARRLRRVRQGLVGVQAHRPRVRPRRPGRLRFQHVRGLQPRGHPEPQGRRLHRGHEGRLRHRRLGRVPRLGPRQPRPLPERGRGLRQLGLPAGLQLRHRVHAPRLPARRDRAHRHLPHHREGREHLHQVQPDALGL